MKSSYLPHVTLAALLMAASLTLFAGLRLARQEEMVRTQVGREEIDDLSSEMLSQVGRLDRLFEQHLRRLAGLELVDRFALRKACERIVGVRQFAVVVEGGGREGFQESFEPGWRGVPMLPGMKPPALGGDLYELPLGEMRFSETGRGWIEAPGQPPMYWERSSPGAYVVITLDPRALELAVHGWLEEWLGEVIEPVTATGALVRIAGSRGEIRSVDTGIDLPPDLVTPVRGRFGRWKVAAWDRRAVRVSHDLPTLAIAVGLAAVFAVMGGGAFLMLRRALRLGEQRVSFVNRVSHELRTPLTNILLNNDLASDALELGDERAASDRLAVVREEAGRLSRLIANVLTFSRSGDDTVSVGSEVIVLAELVEGTLAPFRASLERKGIAVEVQVERGLRAVGDGDLAAQVLANLISNVEKYAAGGGQLRITAFPEQGGGQVSLWVTDRGPGIPKAARERIFEPFVRLSQRVDEGVSGTGLGLSIARELSAKMGGELRLEDSGEGAAFVFCLPSAPENVVSMEGREAS